MKKLALGENRVFVELTLSEFQFLANSPARVVPNDTDVDIGWIREIVSIVKDRKQWLVGAKEQAESLALSIGQVLDVKEAEGAIKEI